MRCDVTFNDFVSGNLPPICVMTGTATDDRSPARAVHYPAWPYLLLLLGPIGVIALIVLLYVLREESAGWVPFSQEARSRRTRRRIWRRGAVAVLAALLTLDVLWFDILPGDSVMKSVVGGLAVLAVWVIAARFSGEPLLTLSADATAATIRPVHPRFFEAVETARLDQLYPPSAALRFGGR